MGARARARWSHDHRSATAAGKRREWNRKRRNEEEKRMWSTLTRAALFIEGYTKSARCGSFRRTTRLNGSIPRSLRED
jgi:hypothetical protein